MASQETNPNGNPTLAVVVIAVIMIGAFFLFTGGDDGNTAKAVQGASDIPLAQVVDGKQQVAITVNSGSYSPRTVKVKKGVPVELTFFGQGYGCAAAIVSRDFWSGVKYVAKGQQEVVNFTPSKTGRFKYTCTMGMYTGWIEVV